VQDVQRTRILEAMAEAMAARGAGGSSVTLAEVIARSGVSTAAFHELFADREACLLAAFELSVQRAGKRVAGAYDAEPRWLDAIKAALAALLRFLEHEPALGRLLLVYSMSGGEQVLRRRVQVLDTLAAAVDRGRLESPAGRQQPAEVVGEGVVGAVIAVLQNRLLADEHGGVIELFGSLVSIIVLPYLGATVARRELMRPAPPVRTAAGSKGDESPHEASGSVRLTERTALVLGAIADYPGASNREVADRAGIVDQGQISKLLARLQAAELIAKIDDARPTRGAPNSWQLTDHGEVLLGRAQARDRS
jgi:AcrR family transcriptional regulator/DNA-binding MarR family transcriptional regulator